jgi:hypothetical protein
MNNDSVNTSTIESSSQKGGNAYNTIGVLAQRLLTLSVTPHQRLSGSTQFGPETSSGIASIASQNLRPNNLNI